MDTLIPALVGYGMGSLPIGFALARWRGIDLRRAGSGNVGATNVYRTSGLVLALVVAATDFGKGAASVVVAARIAHGLDPQVTAGVAAIVGHIYPLWLRFRGGKGVATACGVFALLAPLATAVAAAGFVATVWMTRYVSLGSMLATASLPLLAWAFDAPLSIVAGSSLAASLILARHIGNLIRLMDGTERRLGQRT